MIQFMKPKHYKQPINNTVDISAKCASEKINMPVNATNNEQQVLENFKINALSVILFDSIWAIGLPCCAIYVVVPMYLLYFNCSKLLIQLTTISLPFFTFLQIFSSRVCSGSKRKEKNFLVWILFTSCWLIYGLCALTLWNFIPLSIWIVLFIVMAISLSILMHLATPIFAELFIDCIPQQNRGNIIRLRQLSLGSFGIVGIILANNVMDYWQAPSNFHIRFIIGSIIMFFSCCSLLIMRDTIGNKRTKNEEVHASAQNLKELFNNFNFRAFFIFYMMLLAAMNLSPLLISYAKDILKISTAAQDNFILAYFIGNILIGLTIPSLADKFGFRLIAILTSILIIITYIIPLAFSSNKILIFIAYGIYGGCLPLSVNLLANLGSELVKNIRPSTIIAVGGTLAVPLSFSIAPLAGWLVDHFHQGGYLAVFIMGISLALCASLGFILITREPRTGCEIYIRIRRY